MNVHNMLDFIYLVQLSAYAAKLLFRLVKQASLLFVLLILTRKIHTKQMLDVYQVNKCCMTSGLTYQ